MKYINLVALAAAISLGYVSPAAALLSRAWVSGKGSDVAACGPITAPCKTFKYVHDTIIAAGGEIDVADSGEFGPLTITKSLSIVNDGVGVASVQQAAANANAIVVNAGTAGVVHLRGLSIDGLGTGARGILLQAAASLSIVDCSTRRFAMSGIAVLNSSATKFTVTNTVSSENAHSGIYLLPKATVKGSLNRFVASHNGYGGVNVDAQIAPASAAVFVSVVDSVASNNGGGGYIASSVASFARPILALDQVTSSSNVKGVSVGANAIIRLARSTITGSSQAGASLGGGVISTLGNNNFTDNAGGDVSGGALTPYTQK